MNETTRAKDSELTTSINDVVISIDSVGNPYSYYSSDKWILWSLNFNVSFSRLSGEFKKATKHLVYKVITNKTLKSKKSAIKNIIEGAVIFEKCITACNGYSYEFIDEDKNYRKVIDQAKNRKLKYKTWKNNLIFISHLYAEKLIIRNIGSADNLARHLSSSGDNISQAICLPERIATIYYRESLSLVEVYYPYRHEISSAYADFITEYERLTGRYTSSITSRKHALKNLNFDLSAIDIEFDYSGHWLSKLRGACYIVIAAFTGCRDGEIKSFNLESYQEKKYAGMTVSVLNGINTKPNLGGVERTTSWVTIPVVKKAIELLWHAFSFAREGWKNQASDIKHVDERNKFLEDADSLFVTLPHSTAKKPNAGRQSIFHSLNSFIRSLDCLATKDDVYEFNTLNPSRKGDLKIGERLHIHPHAFRRTFAVYLVRNKLSSLLDIKYQFKHMNIAMTSWYANQANIASYLDMMIDNELQDEIAGENKNYMTDIFYHLYNEAETLAGPEGKRIKNLRAEGDSTIYLSKEEIRKQVEEGRLSIIEHPGGYCTNPDCDRICDMTVCQYKVVTVEKAKSLVTVRDKLIIKYNEIYSSGIDIPNIMSKIYYEIRSIEKVLSEHNLDFVAFSKKEF